MKKLWEHDDHRLGNGIYKCVYIAVESGGEKT